MPAYATLQLHAATKRQLNAARRPGESYDAVIRRKLEEARRAGEQEFFDELYAALGDRRKLKPLV